MKKTITILVLLVTAASSQISIQVLGQFGGTGTLSGLFKNPCALDVSEDGRIFICDRGNNRVQEFNLKGFLIKDVGGFGWYNEQFDEPADIWARSTISIFIADYNNQRVERYDKDLNYISSLYSNEGGETRFQFREVLSSAYSPQGDIFVLDGGENKVIKFNAQNKGEIAFGFYESGRGQLTSPVQIELTSDYKVVVSDAGAKAIFFYDYFGNFLYKYEHPRFKQPNGIALDNKNRLYVADPVDGSIYIFSDTGNLVKRMDMLGDIMLRHPVDIAVYKLENKYLLFMIDGDSIMVSSLTYDRSKE